MSAEMFIKRLPQNTPPEIAVDIASAFDLVSRFAAKAKEIRSDQRYSVAGQNAKIVEALGRGYADQLSALSNSVAKQRGNVTANRSSLWALATETNALDPAIKTEVRAYLRGLKPTDRMRLVAETNDPAIHEAIFGAPCFLSGVDEQQVADLRDRVTAAKFPETVEKLQTLDVAYAEAATAIQVAGDMLRREAGISPAEFEDASRQKVPSPQAA